MPVGSGTRLACLFFEVSVSFARLATEREAKGIYMVVISPILEVVVARSRGKVPLLKNDVF